MKWALISLVADSACCLHHSIWKPKLRDVSVVKGEAEVLTWFLVIWVILWWSWEVSQDQKLSELEARLQCVNKV